MFKRVDHVEIVTSDMDRAIAFYTQVLGFAVKVRREATLPPLKEISYITLGDTMVELIAVENPAPVVGDPWKDWRVGYRMLALEVDGMDGAIEYLKGKGVAVTWGPTNVGGSIRAEILDPDGLAIELRQW